MSTVTDLSYLLYGIGATSVAGLDSWNAKTGSVKTIAYFAAETPNLGGFGGTGMGHWSLANCPDFSHAFENAKSLNNLDLSFWDMSNVASGAAGATHADMLAGTDALQDLTLGEYVDLAGTSIDDATKTPGRANIQGTWKAKTVDAGNTTAWFGPSEDLVRRYPGGRDLGGDGASTPVAYTWQPGVYGGRFGSGANDAVWWRYDVSVDPATSKPRGDLSIGVDDGSAHQLELTNLVAEQEWEQILWYLYPQYTYDSKGNRTNDPPTYPYQSNKKGALSKVTSFTAKTLPNGSPSVLLSLNSLGAHIAWVGSAYPTQATDGLFANYYTGMETFDGTGFAVLDTTASPNVGV